MQGRVEPSATGPAWRVVFPDSEHAAATSYLLELAASDCSPATIRSYAFDLLRWFRFIDGQLVQWDRAERIDIRAFVEHMRETPTAQSLRRSRNRAEWHTIKGGDEVTETPAPFSARTINHQLSVLFGFYEHACAADLGPLVNPVPAQRTRGGGRPHAHHNPMEEFSTRHRGSYRQKTPRPAWRGLSDDAAAALFGAGGIDDPPGIPATVVAADVEPVSGACDLGDGHGALDG